MTTPLPFIPDAASIDDAVRDSLDIIAAVRENTTGLAINTARLDVMQADIVACRADALRAASCERGDGGGCEVGPRAEGYRRLETDGGAGSREWARP